MSELLIMAAFFHVILYTLCNVITSSNFPPRTDATMIIPSLILIGISIVCMRSRSVNKSVWEGFSLCEKPCKLTILLLGSSFHEWVVRIMNVQWYSLFLYGFFLFLFFRVHSWRSPWRSHVVVVVFLHLISQCVYCDFFLQEENHKLTASLGLCCKYLFGLLCLL